MRPQLSLSQLLLLRILFRAALACSCEMNWLIWNLQGNFSKWKTTKWDYWNYWKLLQHKLQAIVRCEKKEWGWHDCRTGAHEDFSGIFYSRIICVTKMVKIRKERILSITKKSPMKTEGQGAAILQTVTSAKPQQHPLAQLNLLRTLLLSSCPSVLLSLFPLPLLLLSPSPLLFPFLLLSFSFLPSLLVLLSSSFPAPTPIHCAETVCGWCPHQPSFGRSVYLFDLI